MVEPGYGWVRVSQFQERTVDDFVRKIEELYKQDPNLKGLVLDLRNDPGGLLDAVGGPVGGLPAGRRAGGQHQRPGQPNRATVFKASPEFYMPAVRWQRPVAPPAGGGEDGAAGGAGERRLGLG